MKTKLQMVGNKFAISKVQETKIKSALLEKNEIKNAKQQWYTESKLKAIHILEIGAVILSY